MDTLVQDIRYGMRQLWRSRGFAAAAIATLALGIGANTALFTLGKEILLRPLPGIGAAKSLVWVMATRPGGQPTGVSFPDYQDFRAGLAGQVDLAAVADWRFALGAADGAEPARVRGEVVSGNYFSVLRTPFALGRGFLASEDSAASPRDVVVLGYELWQQRFNGDAAIIGKTVVVNAQPLTVVGVVGRGFNGTSIEGQRDVWLPIAQHDVARPEFAGSLHRRTTRWLKPIGRMVNGASVESVDPLARAIAGRIVDADTTLRSEGRGARAYSAASAVPPGAEAEVSQLAILSLVVTGLILLLACANVSNLLLARGVSRHREFAVRLSLGAGRWRLVRQLLTESILLAALAGVSGLLLSFWVTDFVVTSGVLPLRLDVRPDLAVIGFTLLAAAGAAVAFGLVPALESTRSDIAAAVKSAVIGRDPRRARVQSAFVVAQVSLSLALLTTAGLFLRSMQKARSVDIGFEASTQVLALSFDLGLLRYSDQRASVFLDAAATRAGAMPGVQAVSFTDVAPLGNRFIATEIAVERAIPDSSARVEVLPLTVFQAIVRPDYFRALGVRLVRGRDFARLDDRRSDAVAIVSEGFARQTWPQANPIGQRISLSGERGPFLSIVGVANDVMLGGPGTERRSVVYLPHAQHAAPRGLTMLVRTGEAIAPLAEALRRDLRAMEPNLPMYDIRTLADYRRERLAERRHGAWILGSFGVLALLLASIGVYGVMAFAVLQRTREVGIRIALGAQRGSVIALFLGRGMRLTLAGLGIGTALSIALSRLMQGLLFGLTPTDAATFTGTALLLGAVACLACWLPARRAASIDPSTALRSD